MRYSDVILNDDNFDTELEKLSEIVGIHFNNYDNFVEKLDKKFKCQTHPLGFEEWIDMRVLPNHSIDCVSPIIESGMAYEFGNGFIIFRERDSMWD
jgi:hypothetical protein